jgi:hypothetical protein
MIEPPTRDDAGDALGGEGNVAQQNARVDGEVVHALFGLLGQRIEEDLDVQVLDLALHLFQRLVDGDGSHGHGRIAQDPLARLVDVAFPSTNP